MKRLLLAGLCILTALLSTPVFAADSGAKALDNAFVKGVTAGDIEAVVALYAADATLYPPERWSRRAATRSAPSGEGSLPPTRSRNASSSRRATGRSETPQSAGDNSGLCKCGVGYTLLNIRFITI